MSSIVEKNQGFTLLELIIVIIILGILSVSAVSRFSGTSGYAEYTYQARLIASLRHMQQRAMQDTRPGYCFQVNFSPAAFGPPTLSYDTADSGPSCNPSIDFSNPDYLRSSATEMADEGVAFGALSFSYIGFDNLGRPLSDLANCSAGCQLDLVGEETLSICIGSQGYIHACQ